MALQTSGSISLSDIQAEFGGSNPISISEYYGAADELPSSGTISFNNFYGTADFTGGLTNDDSRFPRGISASGASGTRSSTTAVVFPAKTKTIFFASSCLDNGYQTVKVGGITVNGQACTSRAYATDDGEYQGHSSVWDVQLPSQLTVDTTLNVVVTMSNSASASGSASVWCFVSEFGIISAQGASGTEGGKSATMNIWDKGLILGTGQSGVGGGHTYGAFNTYVNNPWGGVDGSWGSYSRGYGYVVPNENTSGTVGVYADGTDYGQSVAMCSYRLG